MDCLFLISLNLDCASYLFITTCIFLLSNDLLDIHTVGSFACFMIFKGMLERL